MEKDLELFIRDFEKVKNRGFIPSNRSHNTGIGKTYEDHLGVVENNSKDADLHGFEIKSHRSYSESYITLFTKSPTMPPKANSILKDNYGYIDNPCCNVKSLRTSIFYHRYSNSEKSGYQFRLRINEEEERIYIEVSNNNGFSNLDTYYSFTAIKNAMKKLDRLAFISAQTEQRIDGEYFHYKKATIFYNMKDFSNFLKLIKEGKIMYDIRIGYYKTGEKIGKPHDHGSGFRIKKENLKALYESYIEI